MRAFALMVGLLSLAGAAQAKNPIVPGWYADPEIRIFGGQYWIYPTYSDHYGTPDVSKTVTDGQKWHAAQDYVYPPFRTQTFFNVFSSPDLVHWTKHAHSLDIKDVSWACLCGMGPFSGQKRRQILSVLRG